MAEPMIVLPGGFKTPDGLYLPSSFSAAELSTDLPAELRPNPSLLIVGEPPSFLDQVYAYATERELGFDVHPRDVVVGAVSEIPFWPAMRILARYQRDLWPARVSQEGQRRLLHRWYGDDSPFVRNALAFIAQSDRRMLFSEQQLFALQKLVILYSPDSEPDAELDATQYLGLMIALAAVPGSVLTTEALEELATEEATEDVQDERWMQLFMGHGGFIGKGSLKHELARAHQLYDVLTKSEHAREQEDWCPIDDWLVETYGLSFVELQAVGFALHAGSKIAETEEAPVLIEVAYFKPTAFSDKAEAGLEALSADRDWYRELFARTKDDDRRMAFEITPFLQRPALRHPQGRIMPLAPRALEGWLGATGAFYRIFDAARENGDAARKRFTRYNGYLTERYAVLS